MFGYPSQTVWANRPLPPGFPQAGYFQPQYAPPGPGFPQQAYYMAPAPGPPLQAHMPPPRFIYQPQPASRPPPPAPAPSSRPATIPHPHARPPSPVYFYRPHQPYFEFTNFSPHSVVHRNKRYRTAEHLFQAFKYLGVRPDIAEYIRSLRTPEDALAEGRRYHDAQRGDWKDVRESVMDNVLYLKFTQHPHLADILKSTDGRELIEDSRTNSFWGCGANGKGQNKLGKALMRLRGTLLER
ncbi:hypothetical protein OF83DRAFT_179873 [Amylostereum chailletii]|nr:hypothetical protein OF83DRAFT_179873 [Amylostereum chailletii]